MNVLFIVNVKILRLFMTICATSIMMIIVMTTIGC